MNKYIIKPDLPEITEEEYWETIAKGRKVEPLNKPCKDCAITTGFYKEYADMLTKQSKDMQKEVMNSWYCHNNCNRGCAGIRELLNNSL